MAVVYATERELIETLGIVKTLKFAMRFGGGRVYVPRQENLKPESLIVATIGWDAALCLARGWPGFEIMVPRCVRIARLRRNRAMRGEPATMTVGAIARKYGLTERCTSQILGNRRDRARSSSE